MSFIIDLVKYAGAAGLVSKSGALALARPPGTVVLFGDSIVEQYNVSSGFLTSLTQSAGIATLVKSGHGLAVGDTIRINGATDSKYNGRFTALTVADSSHATFAVDPTAAATDSSVVAYLLYEHRVSSRCWATHLISRLDARFTVVKNAGRGGDDSDQMIARITDMTLAGAAECWKQSGTNDIFKSSFTTAKIKANDQIIYAAAKAAGIYMRETSIPPHVNGTTAQKQQVLEINRWRREYWAANSGGQYNDTYSPLVTSTTGAVKSNVLYDTVHHSNLGGYLVAKSIAPNFGTPNQATAGLTSSILDTYITDSSNRNVFDFPIMGNLGVTAGVATNSAGGSVPSGTVADGCKVSVDVGAGVTVACSIAARAVSTDGDDYGNNQHLVIASTANGDQVTFLTNQVMTSRVTNGQTMTAELVVTVSSSTNLKGLGFNLALQTATTGNFGPTWEEFGSVDLVYPSETYTKTYRVPVTAIRTPIGTHGAPSLIRGTLTITFAGTGGVTLDIAKLAIIKAS